MIKSGSIKESFGLFTPEMSDIRTTDALINFNCFSNMDVSGDSVIEHNPSNSQSSTIINRIKRRNK